MIFDYLALLYIQLIKIDLISPQGKRQSRDMETSTEQDLFSSSPESSSETLPGPLPDPPLTLTSTGSVKGQGLHSIREEKDTNNSHGSADVYETIFNVKRTHDAEGVTNFSENKVNSDQDSKTKIMNSDKTVDHRHSNNVLGHQVKQLNENKIQSDDIKDVEKVTNIEPQEEKVILRPKSTRLSSSDSSRMHVKSSESGSSSSQEDLAHFPEEHSILQGKIGLTCM